MPSGSVQRCPFSISSMALESDVRQALINDKANACPMAVRLAWHASGTFQQSDNTGGSSGATMRFEPESSDGANKGLSIISDILLRVKKAYKDLSFADLWTYAGGKAVEFTGGPPIDFTFGRTDASSGQYVPPNGRLPDGALGAQHLRDVFYRMGFDDREIVVLSGAHTLGRCHLSRSGFDGPWTKNPLVFDNSYFKNLVGLTWVESQRAAPNKQYEDKETGELMMLPTDMALIQDPAFKPHVERFAKNEKAFREEFAVAFKKLMELNMPAASDVEAPNADNQEFREQAMHGSLAKVKALVAKGIDAHEVEHNSGRSALHKAAFWGHTHLMSLLVEECKIDVNLRDSKGDTALHDAARFGHVGVVKYILANGADAGVKNNEGQTAKDVAIEYEKQAVVDQFKFASY